MLIQYTVCSCQNTTFFFRMLLWWLNNFTPEKKLNSFIFHVLVQLIWHRNYDIKKKNQVHDHCKEKQGVTTLCFIYFSQGCYVSLQTPWRPVSSHFYSKDNSHQDWHNSLTFTLNDKEFTFLLMLVLTENYCWRNRAQQ